MKQVFKFILAVCVFFMAYNSSEAQENYGGVLNSFVKFGDNSSIAAHYEIQVAPNLTFSPEGRIWFSGDNFLALGARSDYYFDDIFNLSEPWDIWGGVDAGFIVDGVDNFDLNLHVGIEYKLSETFGLILVFGGGTTTAGGIGLGIHL
ncbi:hypothetical protein [Winogradskyella sp.]|uniref:hypothetical protein n=1 Tax=Winogradskyella sp. TaxID=1883156 RepID=UPI0035C873C6